ncbi:SAM-dependent methyltransferase [Camelimonas lactis]|uniref:Cyclopropane-fatty-acyl-phospholipid synthase n=1 Tax=Camelimonas lactis TaxID=659006 RepID=A0A4R2GZD2_9HYPH|nr:cyclopropane-fatty-acyl-phospholipid synthase family protein [Camelimonas lactis]TCO16046.1 cyclopropane-fatty-acyl-phospholipid synthase [Camelimonas lactis]
MDYVAFLLKSLVKTGSLKVIGPDGAQTTWGDGQGKPVVIRVSEKLSRPGLLLNADLLIGEAFMDGDLEIVEGDVYDLLELAARNLWASGRTPPTELLNQTWRRLIRRAQQFNPVGASRRQVAHHYDLSAALFDNFLDPDRQYSCAYFAKPDDSIELAQAQKKRHLAAKLMLEPGQKVLDIGCGWGGLGLYLARAADVSVSGITLSDEQLLVARERAAGSGLADRVDFRHCDYRNERGRYDRIISVGMFEHVGINHYDAFFRKVRDLLTDDGVAVVHAIGRSDGPGATNAWIQKYIFPGGYSPALSEVLPALERAGLIATDIEILRLHYAETLKAWRERFNANRDAIRALYDEKFCRMWEFYLAGSEVTFRYGGHMVFQIQMAKKVDTVPLTRDYMFEAEQRLPLFPEGIATPQPAPLPPRPAPAIDEPVAPQPAGLASNDDAAPIPQTHPVAVDADPATIPPAASEEAGPATASRPLDRPRELAGQISAAGG